MAIEDLRMDISICNYLCEMTKVKKFTLGTVVYNDEDTNKYLIVGVTFKKIENYPRFVYVLLSYANLFHGIKKEGNKYVYVRAEELYKNYKAVDRFPLNKEMLDYLDRDILLNYSISMNLIETFSSIKVGSLLEYMQGVWYSLVLEKKNDSFIVMAIEASMIEKSFKTLEEYIIDRVKLGKLDRIETMYQRYTTKVIKQYDEHEVNLLVNKLKLLDLYKD